MPCGQSRHQPGKRGHEPAIDPHDTLVHTMDRDEEDLSIAHRPCAGPGKKPAWSSVPAPLRTRGRLLDSSGNQGSCRSCLPRLRKPWSGMTFKVYPGGHQAVRGVSLSVARGEVLASWAPADRVRRLSSRWSTRRSNPLPDGSSCAIHVRPSGTRLRCDVDRLRDPGGRSDAASLGTGQRRPGRKSPGEPASRAAFAGGLAARAGRPGPGAVRPALSPAAQRRSTAASGSCACAAASSDLILMDEPFAPSTRSPAELQDQFRLSSGD